MLSIAKESGYMKYLTINEKRMNKACLGKKIKKVYKNGKFNIRYKRSQTQVYFFNKDLTEQQVIEIAKKLGMEVISKSFARAVIQP